jgi:hypothetical protein
MVWRLHRQLRYKRKAMLHTRYKRARDKALPAARAFRCKSSPFLPATSLRAVGFTLQSLTRPTRNTAKIYFTCHYVFFRASLMVTRNDDS